MSGPFNIKRPETFVEAVEHYNVDKDTMSTPEDIRRRMRMGMLIPTNEKEFIEGIQKEFDSRNNGLILNYTDVNTNNGEIIEELEIDIPGIDFDARVTINKLIKVIEELTKRVGTLESQNQVKKL